jgi:hypothetical protein
MHKLGELLLAHTVDGGIMLGILTNIDKSLFNETFNLYTVTWFKGIDSTDVRDYTYHNICKLKQNLKEYLSYDKT